MSYFDLVCMGCVNVFVRFICGNEIGIGFVAMFYGSVGNLTSKDVIYCNTFCGCERRGLVFGDW